MIFNKIYNKLFKKTITEAPVILKTEMTPIDHNSNRYIKIMKKSGLVSEYEQDQDLVSEAKTLLEKLKNNETAFVSYLYQIFSKNQREDVINEFKNTSLSDEEIQKLMITYDSVEYEDNRWQRFKSSFLIKENIS